MQTKAKQKHLRNNECSDELELISAISNPKRETEHSLSEPAYNKSCCKKEMSSFEWELISARSLAHQGSHFWVPMPPEMPGATDKPLKAHQGSHFLFQCSQEMPGAILSSVAISAQARWLSHPSVVIAKENGVGIL